MGLNEIIASSGIGPELSEESMARILAKWNYVSKIGPKKAKFKPRDIIEGICYDNYQSDFKLQGTRLPPLNRVLNWKDENYEYVEEVPTNGRSFIVDSYEKTNRYVLYNMSGPSVTKIYAHIDKIDQGNNFIKTGHVEPHETLKMEEYYDAIQRVLMVNANTVIEKETGKEHYLEFVGRKFKLNAEQIESLFKLVSIKADEELAKEKNSKKK